MSKGKAVLLTVVGVAAVFGVAVVLDEVFFNLDRVKTDRKYYKMMFDDAKVDDNSLASDNQTTPTDQIAPIDQPMATSTEEVPAWNMPNGE